MDIKLKKIEKDQKLEIEGAEIQREWKGNELSSVKITIGDKHFIVSKTGWDNMSIFVPEAPKEIKKYRLTGTNTDHSGNEEKYDLTFSDISAANEFKESRPWLSLTEQVDLVY